MPAFLHIYSHLANELSSTVTSQCRETVDSSLTRAAVLEHQKDVLSQEKEAELTRLQNAKEDISALRDEMVRDFLQRSRVFLH
jgi:hypothetical protein